MPNGKETQRGSLPIRSLRLLPHSDFVPATRFPGGGSVSAVKSISRFCKFSVSLFSRKFRFLRDLQNRTTNMKMAKFIIS